MKELRKEGGECAVVRKIRKSKYKEIKESCHKTNKKYTDEEFLKGNKDLPYKWKRLSEIIPNASFMREFITPI
jgi:hypothetical protein